MKKTLLLTAAVLSLTGGIALPTSYAFAQASGDDSHESPVDDDSCDSGSAGCSDDGSNDDGDDDSNDDGDDDSNDDGDDDHGGDDGDGGDNGGGDED